MASRADDREHILAHSDLKGLELRLGGSTHLRATLHLRNLDGLVPSKYMDPNLLGVGSNRPKLLTIGHAI